MKRFITILLSALFVFGLSATAFAIHAEIPAETQSVVAAGTTQITLGGDLRVRGWYLQDIGEFTFTVPGGTTAVRLPAEDSSAAYYDERVRVSVDAASGGVSGRVHLESNAGNKDVYTWGNFESKPTDINILEAWIQYTGTGLLGVPAGIKLGHMPLALGPAKLFFDHTKFGDDAIVAFANPSPDTHVALLTIKFDEGTQIDGAADSFLPATNGIWDGTDDLDGYVALINQKFGNTQAGIYAVLLNLPDGDFQMWDVGAHAVGNFNGLSFTVQGDIQFGDVAEDVSASGWAVWLDLGYKVDPIGLRLMAAMGTGQDPDETDVTQFINFLGSNRYYTVVYDYQVAGACGARFQGICNTTVVDLGVDLKPVENLSLAVDGYWLRASEDIVDENDLGWEIDAKLNYDITKNLKYFVWAGYFNAGDVYGDDAGSPTVVMHGLEFAF